MKKYIKGLTLFQLFLIIATITLLFKPIETFASPLNDFDINMEVNNGEANINVVSSDVSKVVADDSNMFSQLLRQYSSVVIGFFGIASLTCVLVFVINFIQLANSAGNSTNRSKALTTLLWSGISAALLGGVAIIVSVSYGFLR